MPSSQQLSIKKSKKNIMGFISKIEDKLAGNSQAKEERRFEEHGQTGNWLPGQSGHNTAGHTGLGSHNAGTSGLTSATGGPTDSSFQHPIGSGMGPTGSAVGGHGSTMADRTRGEGYGNTQGNHGYSGTQAYSNDRPTTTERLRDDLPGTHSNTTGNSNTLGHSTSQGHSTIESNERALAGNQRHSGTTGHSTVDSNNKPSLAERAREALPGNHSNSTRRSNDLSRNDNQGFSSNQGYTTQTVTTTQTASHRDKPSMMERAREALPGNHSKSQGHSTIDSNSTPGHSSNQSYTATDSNYNNTKPSITERAREALPGNHSNTQGHSTIDSNNNHGLSSNQGYAGTDSNYNNTKPSITERAREALPGNHSNTNTHSGNQGYAPGDSSNTYGHSTVDSNYNNKPTTTERAREALPGNHSQTSHHTATGSHGVDQYTSSGQRAAAMAGEERGVTRTSHGGISNSQHIPGRTSEDRGVSRTDHSGIGSNNLNPPGYSAGPHPNMENDRAIPIAGGERVGSVGSADNTYGTGSRNTHNDRSSTSQGTSFGDKARNLVDKVTPGRDSDRSEYDSAREHGITSHSGQDAYSRGIEDGDKHMNTGSQHSSVPASRAAHGLDHAASQGPAYEAGFREAMKHHEAGYKAAMESLNHPDHKH